MAKLIITEKQYNAILEHVKQLKVSINEGDKAITIDLGVLLALGTILEFNITGHNKIKAEKALKDVKTFEVIKDILSSEDKIKELVKSFEIKGMPDPTKKLSDNKSKLISKFNKLSKDNGFAVKLGSKSLVNLHHLKKQ
jgi:hypothetical protein